MKLQLSEVELAKRVIEYLADLHWDVYQEVQPFGGGPIADIVALQNNITWTIETKLSLSLSVLGQAYNWTHLSNYVSVAVPYARRSSHEFGQTVMKRFGIGMLRISVGYYEREEIVRELVSPPLHRAIGNYLRNSLNEGHKTYAEAGNNNGRRWSPFKQTCDNIRRYVAVNPGVSLKEIVSNVSNHYASTSTAKSCIASWGEAGKIEGVRLEKENGQWRFYPQ